MNTKPNIMKARIPLTIVAILAFAVQCFAQYCGTSGSSVCNIAPLAVSGHTPNNDIPCIVRGQQTNLTIQFKNYDTIRVNGILLTMQNCRYDSIENLPSGLCWATNKSDNTFTNQEDGCIKISGLTNAPAGQYKLRIIFNLNFGIGPVTANAEQAGLEPIYIRVIDNAASVCPPIDTSLTTPEDPGVNLDSVGTVKGKVFVDANSNGTYDQGEAGIRNVLVTVGSFLAITNTQGDYAAYVNTGNYTVTASTPESGAYTYAQASTSVNVTALGTVYANNNFAATVTPNHCEGLLTVGNYGFPPRPGFQNQIQVRFTNTLSQTPLTQTIRLTYSAPQLYTNAVPTPSHVDTDSGFIEWQLNNFPMGTSWGALVDFGTPIGTALGTQVSNVASIHNSSCASLNALTTSEFISVVGSYDPNDKAVSPIGFSDHHGINPNNIDRLTYKVRFQNTGTFLAERVIIVDTISPNLDLATLQVVAASHNYEVAIGDDRAVKFIFNQIMLPDSNSNEPESHGYIQYTIKPNQGLAQNTQITNKADIYFDFNDPIRTNTAYNTVDYNVVGIMETVNDYSLSLYPNPANSTLQVNIDERLLGKQLSLSDLSGRVLLSIKADKPSIQIDMSSFAKGVYLVRTGNTVKKLVKE